MADLVATAEIDVEAPAERVWAALTDPRQIQQYMFGSNVETDWTPGSAISWKGEYNGKAYEDKGKVVAVEPAKLLVVTHFSPLSGLADTPANYHTLTYRLAPRGSGTHLSLSQDHNATDDEARHSQENWQAMLTALKGVVEAS
jgi:uncharacterized protein YndB with AHSA1/START domain